MRRMPASVRQSSTLLTTLEPLRSQKAWRTRPTCRPFTAWDATWAKASSSRARCRRPISCRYFATAFRRDRRRDGPDTAGGVAEAGNMSGRQAVQAEDRDAAELEARHAINQRIFETSQDLILVVDRRGTF